MKIFVLLLFTLFSNALTAQITNPPGYPLNLYQQFNGQYDYTIIGKTHNTSDSYINPNPPASALLTASSASLSLQPGQTIVGAYLIWAGVGTGAGTSLSLNGITQFPDSIQTITFSTNTYFYKAIKDITPYVQSLGNVNYQVSNLNYAYNSQYSYGYFQGWNIVVVFSNPNLPAKQINIYDGFVTNYSLPIVLPITNLLVSSTAGAKFSYIAYAGSNVVWFPLNLIS